MLQAVTEKPYSYSNRLPQEISALEKPSLLKNLWKKICHLALKIFNFFYHSPSIIELFNARDITLLQPIPQRSNEHDGIPAPSIDRKPPLTLHCKPVTNKNSSNHSPPAYVLYDSSLEELRRCLRGFLNLTIDAVHKKYLETPIESIQSTASSLPSILKSIAKPLIELGDKATKPIFQRFAQQKAQIIDPTLQKIFRLLVKNGLPLSDLYRDLRERLHSSLKDTPIPINQNLDYDYICPILEWLISSDHQTPMMTLFSPTTQYSEVLIDSVFEQAITLLVEKKVDFFASQIGKTIEHRLSSIVKHMLKINAIRIVDFFSERFSDLITHTSFREMFDQIIHEGIAPHVRALVAMENSQQEHIALLEKAKKTAAISPANELEADIQARANDHLKRVAYEGGEVAFLEHMKLLEFSQHEACSHVNKQIIEETLLLSAKERASDMALQSSEQVLFSSLADHLFDLLLPTKKQLNADGVIKEIPAFSALWSRLYQPKEFSSVFKQVQELADELITPDTIFLFGQIKQPVVEILQTLFTSLSQDFLKKQLAKALPKIFEMLTLPEKFNDLAATSIFPLLNEELIATFISQEIVRSADIMAPLFDHLIHDDPTSRETNIDTLLKAVVDLTQKKFLHFNGSRFHSEEQHNEETSHLVYRDLSDDEWRQIALPEIELIEEKIRSQLKSHPTKNIITILMEEEPCHIAAQPVFGEMITSLIFSLGKWPYGGLISRTLKGVLSQRVTEATEPLRVSHHFLIRAITKGLKKQLLDPAFIEQLFSSEHSPTPKCTKEHLAHQMKITAQITYDLIDKIVENKSRILAYVTRKYLTDTPKALAELIQTVYQKVFDNRIINQNLLTRICKTVFHALDKASYEIRNQEHLHIRLLSLN